MPLARRLTVLLVLLVLGSLRLAVIASHFEPQFDHEFHALGTLALDLDAGTAKLAPRDFVATYTYIHPSSLITQVVHSLLALPLGPTSFAQRLTSVLAELLCLALLAALLVRRWHPGLVLIALLPWLLPHGFALDWLIAPYGNHTEFIWVGVALFGLSLAAPLEGRRLRSWWPAAVPLLLALALYPPGIAAVGAAALALVLRRREAGLAGLRGLGIAAAVTGLCALLGALILPDWLPGADELSALLAPSSWTEAWAFMIPGTGLPLEPWIEPGWLHAAGLIGVAILALRLGPGRAPAAFALAWWAGAFLLAALVPHRVDRYFLPAYFASLLCLSVLALAPAGRWKLPGIALCLALGGTVWPTHAARIELDRWAHTQHYDTLGMTARLGVACASLSELPWYRELLRSGRHSPFVGLLPPERDPDRNCGHVEGEQAVVLERISARLAGLPPAARASALEYAGAGGWISHGRSLAALRLHLERIGLDPASRTAILAGATQAAALSAPFEDGSSASSKVPAAQADEQATPVPTERAAGRLPLPSTPAREDWGRHPAWAAQAHAPMLAEHDVLRLAAATLVPLAADPGTSPEVLTSAVTGFAVQLRAHHAVEEGLAFPWLEQRYELESDPLSVAHRQLESAFAGIDGILGEGRPEHGALRAAVAALDADLREHLRQEEDLCVPILLGLSGAEWVELGPAWIAKNRESASN